MPANYAVILIKISVTLLCLCALPTFANQSVHLTWLASSSPGVTGYNIYYGSESGVYTTTISSGAATELDVDDLPDGLTFYFVVTAYNNAGQESEPSNEASYNVAGLAPPDGAVFIQQILPDHAVILGWNPSPSGEVQGYYVHYGTQSGFYDKLVWVENATAVEIHELADGLMYYFAVAATNSFGLESVLTPEISYSIPQLAPPQEAPVIQQILPSHAVTLTWPASPSPGVLGYIVYYGVSGYYDYSFYVGSADPVDIGGLAEGLTYYFAVAAYNDLGQESARSPEAAYYVEQVAVIVPGVMLSLQQIPAAGFPNTFSITATGPIPASWAVEGSSDLKAWRTLATGVEPEINVAVVVTEKPALFFRLKSWYYDLDLAMPAPPTNAFPNSFVVSTPDYVPWDWTLESSENLESWSPLVAGYFAPVKVAVVHAPAAALYFRLKGD